MDVNLVSPFLFFSFLNSRAGGSIKYCPILLFFAHHASGSEIYQIASTVF